MNRDEIEFGEGTIVMEREYPHPPERVWDALTDPEALSDWLLPTTFRPILGGSFQFVERKPSGRRRKVQCRVVELEAPHRLAYSWKSEEDAAPSLVCWTLEPVESGTLVRLEHLHPEGINLSPKASAAGQFCDASALTSLGHWLLCQTAFAPTGVHRSHRSHESHNSHYSQLSQSPAHNFRRTLTCR